MYAISGTQRSYAHALIRTMLLRNPLPVFPWQTLICLFVHGIFRITSIRQ